MKALSKKAQKEVERQEYIQTALALLKPSQTVYTGLNSVSSSGMSRQISLYVVDNNQIRNITWLVGNILNLKIGSKNGLVVGGCGMDMGFHVVYGLGRALWPNGTPEPHGRRNGEPDSDGGYALKHSWL